MLFSGERGGIPNVWDHPYTTSQTLPNATHTSISSTAARNAAKTGKNNYGTHYLARKYRVERFPNDLYASGYTLFGGLKPTDVQKKKSEKTEKSKFGRKD